MKISEVERKIVVGWTLFEDDEKREVGIERVRSFIDSFFEVQVSTGYVSTLMNESYMRSREILEKPIKRRNPNIIEECTKFLRQWRSACRSVNVVSRLCAVDVCYWTRSK